MAAINHPKPDLQRYATSGLSFPWAQIGSEGFNAHLGSSGVTAGMVMVIYWKDLQVALQELLGYSWRDTTGVPSRLRRKLPWQHPYFNQLFVKNITRVVGVRAEGTSAGDVEAFDLALWGVGEGVPANLGPWAEFRLAYLTIEFWRPPYFVRSDDDILDSNGDPQEWLRYTDRNWELNTQMLSREGSQFVWSGASTTSGKVGGFPGSVGQKISRLKIKRRWYQIPEAALFGTLSDHTPNGLPSNILYTQTETVNPITGYVYRIGSPICGCVNVPIGGALGDGNVYLTGTVTNASAVVTMADTTGVTVGDAISGAGIPTASTVLSIVANTSVTMNQVASSTHAGTNLTFSMDGNSSSRFFGCYTGTLLFEGAAFIPQPLQLPPYLMNIPGFANNEPISQQQYDVEFYFEWFDPPRGAWNGGLTRGHNLMPWSGNGLWYPVNSQLTDTSNVVTTPFQYAQFTDLFQIL